MARTGADWTELKATRAAKPSLAVTSGVRGLPTASSGSSSRKEGQEAAIPAPGELVAYPHADLPPFLEVREFPRRGRGVVAKKALSPGTTLLSTTPLISVLDNRNLQTRCSFCFCAADDTTTQKCLSQCSLCHLVQYCSSTCQTADWKLHKHECKALRTASKSASRGNRNFPDTPVRALARLLWKKEIQGEKLWREVESLQTHRQSLSPGEQERFFHLSVALAQYVGSQEIVARAVGGSGSGMMDLCSRFAANSFSLTSPTDVSNIGVSISPLTALFNHSCAPNAVVVFPDFPSRKSTKHMAVVALRDIATGEEVVTSYIDIGLPKELRQKELKQRYYFDCDCSACKGDRTAVDPREALDCGKKSCRGSDVHPAIEAAKLAYADAEKAQYTDPNLALLHLTHLITSLTSSLSPSPALAPSSHPLLPALQLLLTLQLDASLFSAAVATAQRAWSGVSLIYPYGHPTRALLLSTIARLESVPPAPELGPQAELAYWANEGERVKGILRLVEAVKEVEVAFGKEGQGGEMGRRLRGLVKDQEEGVEMGRKMRMATRV
ncbi:hypothetical protein JCM11641_000350 [Rhodosporidiobolus odoratus]